MTNPPPSPPSPKEQPDINELMRAIAAQQQANSEQIAQNAEGFVELRAATAANQAAVAELKTEISELKATVAETTANVNKLTTAIDAMMPVIASHSQRFELQQATLQTMMAQMLQTDAKVRQLEGVQS